MSLQVILDAIRAAGEAEVREIEARASIQAHEIQADNILEVQLAKEQACLEACSPAARKRARLIHSAHLEAMQRIGGARNALVDKALEKTSECLAHFRADPNYPTVLQKLVREALSELEGSPEDSQHNELDPHSHRKDIHLQADRRDQDILEDILSKMKLKLPVQYELECWGGIIAREKDGRIVSINTLEARLERATPYLRRYLAAFFETEQPQAEFTETGERLNVRF